MDKLIKEIEKNWDLLQSSDFLQSEIDGSNSIEYFENHFAEFADADYAISHTNASTAILTALQALNIKSDDEVLVPEFTWPGSIYPVILLGAKPVMISSEKISTNIDPEKIEEKINSKTKAIIAAHLFGYPCNIKKIMKIAAKNDLKVIFDAAQSLTAIWGKKRTGAFGDFTVFSFGYGKKLNIGGGGMLVCNNKRYFEKAISLSQHPLRCHLQITDTKLRRNAAGLNLNCRMNPTTSILGIIGLRKLINHNQDICSPEFYHLFKHFEKEDLSDIIHRFELEAIPSGDNFIVFPQNITQLYKIKTMKFITKKVNLVSIKNILGENGICCKAVYSVKIKNQES
ncbi:MAG: aminotransferase class V-fold PLP-dependent enzyme [Candidatus Atribacteria bacterium]|nr:aminotransferase class V-fold PLP-dependent enzyme [Candidatus Atribacteria bacterium]